MLTRSAVLATTLTVGLVVGVGSSALAVAFVPGDSPGATQLVEAIASPTQDPAEGSNAWFIESTPVTLTIAQPLVIDGGGEPAAKVDPAPEDTPVPTPSPSASDAGAANGNGGSSSGNSTSPSNPGSTLVDKAKDDKAKEDKAKEDKAKEDKAKSDRKAAEAQAKKATDGQAKKDNKDKDDKAKKDKDQSDAGSAQ